MTAIIVCTTYFIETLTRTPTTGGWGHLSNIGAILIIAVMIWHTVRIRGSLCGSLSTNLVITLPPTLSNTPTSVPRHQTVPDVPCRFLSPH